jgi:hypothetical protein
MSSRRLYVGACTGRHATTALTHTKLVLGVTEETINSKASKRENVSRLQAPVTTGVRSGIFYITLYTTAISTGLVR